MKTKTVVIRLPTDVHERATETAKSWNKTLPVWIQDQIVAGQQPQGRVYTLQEVKAALDRVAMNKRD